MNPAVGPFAIAAVLLVLGGVLKAARPHDTAFALRAMRLPGSAAFVRAGGIAEAVLGVVALVAVDTTIALLVAASYAVFCAFVVVALARHVAITSCGCFGRIDTPPSLLHVGVGLGASIAALALVADPTTSPLDVVTDHFPASVIYVVLVAVGAAAAFALLAVAPRARALAAPPAPM